MKITELDLSVRPMNAMNIAGIQKVAELLQTSPLQLMQLRNFGHRSMAEIAEKLADKGLRLKDDHHYWKRKKYSHRMVCENYQEKHEPVVRVSALEGKGFLRVLGPFAPEQYGLMELHFRDLRSGGIKFALVHSTQQSEAYEIWRKDAREPVGDFNRAMTEVFEKLGILPLATSGTLKTMAQQILLQQSSLKM